MNTLKDFITEASRNEKSRDVKFIKQMFMNGKKYNNIGSFGIITSENPNSGKDFDGMSKSEINSENKRLYNDFKKTLKSANYKFVPAEGKFDNIEHSLLIFNIKQETLATYAGKYEQTSFWYCHPEEDGLNCEYWQKKNVDAPYDSKKNPYELVETSTQWEEIPNADNYYTAIAKKFKFTISCKCFEDVNNEIAQGLIKIHERFDNDMTDEQILEFATNRIGYTAHGYRKVINSITVDDNV